MSDTPPYAARFSYGRLFVDCGRVTGRGWLALAVGVAVLGVAPTVGAALPWWQGDTNAPGVQQIWLGVTTVKTLVVMVTNSMRQVFIAGAALSVLSGQGWRELLQGRRLVAGFTTALGLDLLVNWPALAAPGLQILLPYDVLARIALGLATPACLLLMAPFFGVAVTAAVAEDRWIGPAAARSLRLLRGLRWRMVALTLAYLLCLWASQLGIGIILAITGALYSGLGQAAVGIGGQLLAALFDIAIVSFFLQAQRIADGPSAGELHEVFA